METDASKVAAKSWQANVDNARSAKREPAFSYDGFISYRHDERQSVIARRLQRALHGFAKPFYKLRAVRLYRDETNLSANPNLWPAIQRALDTSRTFILLASREAARSRWVDAEVAHWLVTRGTNGLLLVVSDGTIAWDERAGRFDPSRTDVLPLAALAGIRQEPLWIDLRTLAVPDDLRIEKPVFYDAVASLAASLRGVEKDAIAGEDVRQRRRTFGLVAASALLVATLAVAFFLQQREAAAQRDLAVARLLASEGFRRSQAQPKLAVSYFLGSLSVADTPNAVSGLLGAVQADPHIAMRLLPTAGSVTAAAFSQSGSLAAVGLASGELVVWRPGASASGAGETVLAGAAESRSLPGLGRPIVALGVSDDGMRVAGVDESGRILEWSTALDAKHSPRIHATVPGELARSDGGRALASVSRNGEAVAVATYRGVHVWTTSKGLRTISVPNVASGPVALAPDGSSVAVTLGGDPNKPLAVVSLRGEVEPLFPPAPPQSFGFPTSLDFDSSGARLAAGTSNGGLVVWHLPDAPSVLRAFLHPAEGLLNAGNDIDGVMLGPAGDYAATLHKRHWYLWHIASSTLLGRPFQASASAGAFHPKERLFLMTPTDSLAHVVDFSPAYLLHLGCIIAPRDLTAEEWRELSGDLTPRTPCRDAARANAPG